jgi:hypothetical protein
MTAHCQEEQKLNLIELNLFLEECNQSAADNYQVLLCLCMIQDWLVDLEEQAEKLSHRVRTQKH